MGNLLKPRSRVITSERKTISNRKNAQKSTGPKSELGRLRSSRNAFRHGLAMRLDPTSSFSEDIEALAVTLGSGARGQLLKEFARQAAEAQLDLFRIRKVRQRFSIRSWTIQKPSSGIIPELNESLAQLERYERRAFSRRKRAMLAMRGNSTDLGLKGDCVQPILAHVTARRWLGVRCAVA